MRCVLIVMALAIPMAAFAVAHAQGMPAPRSVSGGIAAEQEVTRAVEEWFAARNENDRDVAERLMASDYLYLSARETAEVSTKEQWLETFRALPRAAAGTAERDDLRVRVYGDTAVATSRIRISRAEASGEVRCIHRLLQVWQKREGRWQLVFQQGHTVTPWHAATPQPTPQGPGQAQTRP
jgi:ketosteroid isomerase-like protein